MFQLCVNYLSMYKEKIVAWSPGLELVARINKSTSYLDSKETLLYLHIHVYISQVRITRQHVRYDTFYLVIETNVSIILFLTNNNV